MLTQHTVPLAWNAKATSCMGNHSFTVKTALMFAADVVLKLTKLEYG